MYHTWFFCGLIPCFARSSSRCEFWLGFIVVKMAKNVLNRLTKSSAWKERPELVKILPYPSSGKILPSSLNCSGQVEGVHIFVSCWWSNTCLLGCLPLSSCKTNDFIWTIRLTPFQKYLTHHQAPNHQAHEGWQTMNSKTYAPQQGMLTAGISDASLMSAERGHSLLCASFLTLLQTSQFPPRKGNNWELYLEESFELVTWSLSPWAENLL